MVTEEIQHNSSYDFSDAAVTSRELQQRGVSIHKCDISVEKEILLMDDKTKFEVPDGKREEIQSPDITKENVLRTLDFHRLFMRPMSSSPMCGLLRFQDIRDGHDSRQKGVIVEQNGNEYVYPVEVAHIVHINPSDPLIDEDYYIKADSEYEAEDIKNDITESRKSYLTSNDTDVVLKTKTEVQENIVLGYTLFGCFLWGLYLGLVLSSGLVSLPSALTLIAGFIWTVLGVISYGDSEGNTKDCRTTKVNRYVSGINADKVAEEYVNDKTNKENVSFGIDESGVVKCTLCNSRIKWTLSENGIVPETVVSELEEKGFFDLDSPNYRVTVMPIEIVEDKNRNLISDCGDWYLNVDSVDVIE